MSAAEYRTQKSKLPPRLYDALMGMSPGDRRVRCQELIGRYDQTRSKLTAIATRNAANWVDKQADHLDVCIRELEVIRDA